MKRNTKVRYDIDDRGGDLPSSRCIHGGMGEVSNQPQPAWEESYENKTANLILSQLQSYAMIANLDGQYQDAISEAIFIAAQEIRVEHEKSLATERLKFQEEARKKIIAEVRKYRFDEMGSNDFFL